MKYEPLSLKYNPRTDNQLIKIQIKNSTHTTRPSCNPVVCARVAVFAGWQEPGSEYRASLRKLAITVDRGSSGQTECVAKAAMSVAPAAHRD